MGTTKNDALATSMVRAGRRTFFFDVKVTSDRKKYLKVTESTFMGEGKEGKYNSLLLFPDTAQAFCDQLGESVRILAK